MAAPPYPTLTQPQQPPTAAWAGAAQVFPGYPEDPYAGAIYAGAMADPTLEAARWKLGLCVNVKATGGACAYFHWGAAQPFPGQQPFAAQPPYPGQQPMAQPPYPGQPPMAQPPMTASPYPALGQPQPPTAGWATTVATPCFSGAAAPTFVPPGYGYPQYHTQPYPGPQTRPATPGSA
jgi:hypothetical protein